MLMISLGNSKRNNGMNLLTIRMKDIVLITEVTDLNVFNGGWVCDGTYDLF